jgi:hypothetical protein
MRRGHFDDQSPTSATTKIAETAMWSGETKILQYGRVILLITQSFGVDAETWNVAFHDPEQTFRAARQTNAVLVGG